MVEEKLLDNLKERKIRALRSFHKERPDSHCNYYINSFLNPDRGEIEKVRSDEERRVEPTAQSRAATSLSAHAFAQDVPP